VVEFISLDAYCLFILGAAAGMMNVYRAVNGMGMSVGYGDTRAKTDLKREE